MRYAWLSWPLALVLVVSAATVLFADGFKLPNLNPFASKKKSSFRLAAPPQRPPAKKPSTWTKFTRGTQKFVGGTVNFFTPSFLKKKPAPAPRVTGSRRIIRAKPQPKKKSPFSFLFPSKEKEKEKPADVSRFLLQDRPGF